MLESEMEKETITIEMPEKVRFIIITLKEAGFDAYAVGGCVRDSLLGRIPNDWDITTVAKPEEVKALFSRTIDTGIQHGTVTVMLEKEGFEVTTYRIDGEYLDGRHPKEVCFTPDLKEDLRRRDFTINAMAYNEEQGLVDAFEGVKDLKEGVIRCVGNARERFEEDALRMLRAIRFAAQLGFTIEEGTKKGIESLAPNIAKVSAERIQVEMVKLLTSKHPECIRIAYETGLTKVFFPEFDAMMQTEQKHIHHCYSVGEHTIVAMQAVEADKYLRFTMLLHDVAKPEVIQIGEDGVTHFYGHQKEGEILARKILRRLKFDNEMIQTVTKLVLWHDAKPKLEERKIRHMIYKIGPDYYPAIFSVMRADAKAQNPAFLQEKLEYIDAYEAIYDKIMGENQCLSIKELAVNGQDLIALGMKPGKELGIVLKKLLEIVLDDPARNQRSDLLELAKRWMEGELWEKDGNTY